MPLSGQDGVTPLLRAARHGHEKVVRMLLDAGAATDAHDQVLGVAEGGAGMGLGSGRQDVICSFWMLPAPLTVSASTSGFAGSGIICRGWGLLGSVGVLRGCRRMARERGGWAGG